MYVCMYYTGLIYAIFMILSVAYWFFYESYQQGRSYFGGRSATNNGTNPTGAQETIKFGSRYGAVVTH